VGYKNNFLSNVKNNHSYIDKQKKRHKLIFQTVFLFENEIFFSITLKFDPL